MGTLLFGRADTITCIQPSKVGGPNGEQLCLAYKTSKLFVGAGVYLKDEGYVLAERTDAKSFYPLSKEDIARWQGTGQLPTPLPSYDIPWYQYAFGYSLWLVLLLCIGLWRLDVRSKKRLAVRDRAVATTLGPPLLTSEMDRFVADQVHPLLEGGETVQHQAYALDRHPDDGAIGLGARYAVLTDRRLIVIKTRFGASGPLAENKGVAVYARRNIVRVDVDARELRVVFDDGRLEILFVTSTNELSNQEAFRVSVPRLLDPRHAEAVAAPAPVSA